MKPKILFLIATCLLFVVACNCGPVPGLKVESQVGAFIRIDAVQHLGSVDLGNVLLKIDGSIQDNQLNGVNKLVVLLLKDYVEVKDAAHNFLNATQITMEEGEISHLADDQGIAYYGHTIPKQYQGPLSIEMRLPKGSLDPMQAYQAYLLVTSGNPAHWVAYSEEGKEVLPPDIGDDATTVAMGSVSTILDYTQPNSPIVFSLQAEILHKKHKLQGGFLLTKQDYAMEVIQAMLAKLLQEGKGADAETQLQALESYPGVFIAANINEDFGQNLGNSIMALTDHDKACQLEEGATYQVYAYVFDEQKNYIVSPQARPLVIPQFEVVLAMQEVAITNLVASMTDLAIQDLRLQLQIDIIQYVGTRKPYLGFLFTKSRAVGQEDARAIIGDTFLRTLTTDAFYHKNEDIIYVADQLDKGKTGKISFTVNATKSNFILGETYLVYCFLYDGKGIFMGKKPMKLALPAVKIHLNSMKSSYNLLANEPIEIGIQYEPAELKNLGSLGGNTEMYYLFNLCDDTNHEEFLRPTVEKFQNILDKAKKKDALEKKNTGIASDIFAFETSGSNAITVLGKQGFYQSNQHQLCIVNKTYAPFRECSQYKLYISFRAGNAIFYSDPFPTMLETYQDVPNAAELKVIPDPDNNFRICYEVKILESIEIWQYNTSTGIKRLLHKEDPLDAEVIHKLLPLIIKYADEADQKKAELGFIKRLV
jgi:hypothetical protein